MIKIYTRFKVYMFTVILCHYFLFQPRIFFFFRCLTVSYITWLVMLMLVDRCCRQTDRDRFITKKSITDIWSYSLFTFEKHDVVFLLPSISQHVLYKKIKPQAELSDPAPQVNNSCCSKNTSYWRSWDSPHRLQQWTQAELSFHFLKGDHLYYGTQRKAFSCG